MFDFMLHNVQVNKNIIEDHPETYRYLYSVESVNQLVKEGKSFRDAYQIIARQILDGSYHAQKTLQHTHEGSIGNLCNKEIEDKFERFYSLKPKVG